MKLSDYLSPSFQMEIEIYEPGHCIQLRGENNWWKLVGSSIIIATILGTVFFLLIHYHSPSLLSFPFFFIAILLITHCYRSLKAARGSQYLKQKIVFDREGIHTNHSDQSDHQISYLSSKLKQMKLIFDNGRFKFVIYQFDQPDFEFSIQPPHGKRYNDFLNDICKILDFRIKDGMSRGISAVVVLTKMTAEEQENTTTSLAVPSLPNLEGHRHRTFYKYTQDGEVIFEERPQQGEEPIPYRLRVNPKTKILWFKKMLVRRVEFKFSDIQSFEVKIDENVVKSTTYIIGQVVLQTISQQKIVIFSVSRMVDSTIELIQFDVFKDMMYLKQLLEEETGISPS